LLVAGDELLHDGPARDGRVRDSLGPQLPGWLGRLRVDTVSVQRVPDTLADHVEALSQAKTDLVVTTGGTAAGRVDFVHQALQQGGFELVVDSVAVRPGHPMLLARSPVSGSAPSGWARGLPGNPQSAVVALLSLGQPLLARLSNQPMPTIQHRVLAADAAAPPTETRLVLCRATGDGADTSVRPVQHLGSGMLRGLAWPGLAAASGFAVVSPGGQPAGATVGWLALP
jgi:molybdopterin molybdotransferase